LDNVFHANLVVKAL